MIWPVILICCLLCCVVSMIVYLSLNTKSKQRHRKKTETEEIDFTSSVSFTEDTEECPTYDTLLDACKESFNSYTTTEPSITTEPALVEDVPKVFRNNTYKSWYYLNRNKMFGYIKCDIFAHDYEDLLSLNDLMRSLGDIAYVKETNKFYIYMSNNKWEEYTEDNYDDLLGELDYMLALEGRNE